MVKSAGKVLNGALHRYVSYRNVHHSYLVATFLKPRSSQSIYTENTEKSLSSLWFFLCVFFVVQLLLNKFQNAKVCDTRIPLVIGIVVIS